MPSKPPLLLHECKLHPGAVTRARAMSRAWARATMEICLPMGMVERPRVVRYSLIKRASFSSSVSTVQKHSGQEENDSSREQRVSAQRPLQSTLHQYVFSVGPQTPSPQTSSWAATGVSRRTVKRTERGRKMGTEKDEVCSILQTVGRTWLEVMGLC